MAFQHPQQRRARHAAHQQQEDYQDDATAELSTSVDSAVLLFGGARGGAHSNALQLDAGPAAAAVDQSTWSLVPPQQRTHSPASTHSSSTSASSSSATNSSSPAGLAHSLFPSHDGGGIFVQGAESLVQSDTGAGGSYSSGVDLDDSSIPSGSSALSDDSSLSGRPARRRRSKDRHPSTLGQSVGGSWALTEEALSAVPHATPLGGGGGLASLARSQGSAEFTSDSSEDESVEGMMGVVIGRKRTPVRRRGEQVDGDEEEDGLSSTPHAVSAGFGGRDGKEMEAYPSPPPEDSQARSRIRIKRRHRHPGRHSGSQKRSSTSGSVAGSEVLAVPFSSSTRRRSPARPRAEKPTSKEHIFLGPLVSRLLAVESSTLDLLNAPSSLFPESTKAPLATPEATPTPSRAASPTRILTTPRPRSPKQEKEHGLGALARHARDELGDEKMFYLSEQEEEDEGDVTETELDHHNPPTQWVASSSPPVFAARPSSAPAPPRSFSASSLPLYIPLTSSNLSSASHSKLRAPLMRRTSSFSSSSPNGGGSPSQEQENAWGGEFEGFEAAMSYWRRLLRVMRGGFGSGVEV